MSVFDTFTKKHDYLVCVDSDGCAMDTMDCKHFHCFGPCMVTEWGLEEWREPILFRWNEVNLYQMTRGINRFKALAICLKERVIGLKSSSFSFLRWFLFHKGSARKDITVIISITANITR